MRILVSNDDGYFAPGITLLAEALRQLGEVTVVAPERDRSGASNSLTLDRPLTVLATSNPALGAEEGETLTAGFVWQPQFADWIDGLQLSLDGYDIQLSGAVAPYGAQRIVDDCFATGAASACNLIQRIPTTDGSIGPISRILNQNINADLARTRGVDLEMIWAFEPIGDPLSFPTQTS